jgi:hypothetical protein
VGRICAQAARLYEQNHYAEAEERFAAAISESERASTTRTVRGACLVGLAATQRKESKYVEAELAARRAVEYLCAATEVPDAIERRRYLATRLPGENLRQFFGRHNDAELRAFLADAEVEAMARDPSPGRPPHDAEG